MSPSLPHLLSRRLAAVVVAVLLAVPLLPAQAQTAVTPEFAVNVLAPQRERSPAVARNASGRTVIVWDDGGTIRARRFDAAGAPLDDGFVIDPAGASPDVAIAADGSFIVSWVQTGAISAAVYRRFDAAGLPLAPVFPVLVGVPPRRPVQTAVALDDQGRFAVATVNSDAPRGISAGPFLLFPIGAGIVDLLVAPIQVNVANFEADGRLVNAATLSRSSDLAFYLALQSVVGQASEGLLPQLGGNVDVALDADGDAVVVWDTISGLGTTPLLVAVGTTLGGVAGSVQVRRLRRGAALPGAPVTVDVGQSLRVESFDPGEIAFAPPAPRPSIARRPDGRLLVAYALPMQFEIVDRPFSVDDRSEVARELRLKTLSPALLPQLRPTVVAPVAEASAVAVDAAGHAVVAWEGARPGPILAQRFDADLAPLAAPVLVGSRARSGFGLTTAPIGLGVAADGSFAVSWQRREPPPTRTLETVRARFYTVP